jgi:hypothetical protein
VCVFTLLKFVSVRAKLQINFYICHCPLAAKMAVDAPSGPARSMSGRSLTSMLSRPIRRKRTDMLISAIDRACACRPTLTCQRCRLCRAYRTEVRLGAKPRILCPVRRYFHTIAPEVVWINANVSSCSDEILAVDVNPALPRRVRCLAGCNMSARFRTRCSTGGTSQNRLRFTDAFSRSS